MRRNKPQLQAELNEIYNLIVAGASDREIMNLRNIKERNYYKYLDKLHHKIVDEAVSRRQDYFLDDIKITKTRLLQDKRALWAIIESDQSNYAAKLEAIQADVQLNLTLMKLEYEGSLYTHGTNAARQQREEANSAPIQLSPASE